MKIVYKCLCGSVVEIEARDRRPVAEIVDLWRIHSQCPALWALRWDRQHPDVTDAAEVMAAASGGPTVVPIPPVGGPVDAIGHGWVEQDTDPTTEMPSRRKNLP
jgi:hypothetical protein